MQKIKTGRKNRLIKQKSNDVYYEKLKISEHSICKDCSALYVKGRWTWDKPEKDVQETICPACRRIADNYPAGTIELKGAFFWEHQVEIMNLIRNTEEQEKNAHALERIIRTRKKPDSTIITTTGIHLARRIGESLSRSYKGNFSFQYLDTDKGIRVAWERD